jgi:hypothetical protein
MSPVSEISAVSDFPLCFTCLPPEYLLPFWLGLNLTEEKATREEGKRK